MSFQDLVGKRVGFCGVDNTSFCVVTPEGARLAFEAVEDKNDRYRSMLKEVKDVLLDGLIFFAAPIVTLTVETVDGPVGQWGYVFSGWRLVDDEDHEWLRLGTDNCNDYYPCFTFMYDPSKDLCLDHEDCQGVEEMARACKARSATPPLGETDPK